MALTLENCMWKTIVSALSQRGSDVERREPNGFYFRLRPARFRRDTIHFGREIYQLNSEPELNYGFIFIMSLRSP